MATANIHTGGIDWNRVARRTTRFVWATLVLAVKLGFIIISLFASLMVALCVTRKDVDEDNEHDDREYGVPAVSFDRESPINKYAPYD